jgi:hypothetical protein
LENVLVACSGFRLIPKVAEYLLLDATTLYDTELKKVEFSDPTSIYSPLCTQYRQDDRRTCLECRRLQCRLCTRAVSFEKCRQDQTLTKKSTEELCTPEMMKAAIEEAIAQRKAQDKLKETDEVLEDWKKPFLDNYKQFLASQEPKTFLLCFIDFQAISRERSKTVKVSRRDNKILKEF